jgi:hypothetical protein
MKNPGDPYRDRRQTVSILGPPWSVSQNDLHCVDATLSTISSSSFHREEPLVTTVDLNGFDLPWVYVTYRRCLQIVVAL